MPGHRRARVGDGGTAAAGVGRWVKRQRRTRWLDLAVVVAVDEDPAFCDRPVVRPITDETGIQRTNVEYPDLDLSQRGPDGSYADQIDTALDAEAMGIDVWIPRDQVDVEPGCADSGPGPGAPATPAPAPAGEVPRAEPRPPPRTRRAIRAR